MKRYKILWSESNKSKSENSNLLERKNIDSLEELRSRIEEDSRFSKYSNITVPFFLNGLTIKREDYKGNTYTPEISFAPCYFKSSKNLRALLEDSIDIKPEIRDNYSKLERKIEKNQRIPITSIIESCEATNQNFWNLIQGEKLAGKTSSNYITIPEKTPALEKLVAWILTEGHIPLSHPSIEINQVKSEARQLRNLCKDIEDTFQKESVTKFSDTKSWSGEEGKRLIISSAAVRQFLVLKYDIPLGKKSKNISWNINISKENYRELLSCFIQTEGSINISRNQPRFEFKIQDKEVRNACEDCLNELGCSPKSSKSDTFNTGIYSINDFLKLTYFIREELESSSTLQKAEEAIQDPRILYQVKDQKWCKYVNKARNKLDNDKPNKEFAKQHNKIFSEIEIINHARVSSWALEKSPTPLSAALMSSQILDIKSEEVLDKHLQSYISSSSVEKYAEPKL